MGEVSASGLATHPFLRGMARDHLAVLAGDARAVRFPARCRVFEDGGHADRFWLIRAGHVSLDLHIPGQGPVVIDSVGMGELLGWSWMFPPYRWAFGAVTATEVEAFEFDAPVVRKRCQADAELGYALNQRITRVLAQRLHATRLRLTTRAGPAASGP